MSVKEARARIKINKLLEDAGWRFFDDANGPVNIQLEANAKITKKQYQDFGENFEKIKNGVIDSGEGTKRVRYRRQASHRDRYCTDQFQPAKATPQAGRLLSVLSFGCRLRKQNGSITVPKVHDNFLQSGLDKGTIIIAATLLQKIKSKVAELDHWTDKQETKAAIDNLIRDTLWTELPKCYDEVSISSYRQQIYEYVYTRYGAVA